MFNPIYYIVLLIEEKSQSRAVFNVANVCAKSGSDPVKTDTAACPSARDKSDILLSTHQLQMQLVGSVCTDSRRISAWNTNAILMPCTHAVLFNNCS